MVCTPGPDMPLLAHMLNLGEPAFVQAPRPSEPVLETITSPFGDDDTGGGSCHESPPRPPPV
nr:hypothetical protein [Tanacetum cinerariifolium]